MICPPCREAADSKNDNHGACIGIKTPGSCDCQHRPRWGKRKRVARK